MGDMHSGVASPSDEKSKQSKVALFGVVCGTRLIPFCLQYFAHEFGFSEYLEPSSAGAASHIPLRNNQLALI